jgi:hypothetical protein
MATCDFFPSKYDDFCKFFFPKKVLSQLVLGFFNHHNVKIQKKTKKNIFNELHEPRLNVTKN